jgi:hypothetical protein
MGNHGDAPQFVSKPGIGRGLETPVGNGVSSSLCHKFALTIDQGQTDHVIGNSPLLHPSLQMIPVIVFIQLVLNVYSPDSLGGGREKPEKPCWTGF